MQQPLPKVDHNHGLESRLPKTNMPNRSDDDVAIVKPVNVDATKLNSSKRFDRVLYWPDLKPFASAN
ncbi:hypothetical protein GWI33_013307 [Rhynchophorus ferrugineus]|uniref:Uncharacterized protein n=1 Tax=Rhynchophorus ferrugineus TaxID=354439 RepID=A0A834MA33_RHYFE|nr:hypothetical protein GWI33_013307 [Rhynchophorus ferrugineus]